MNNIPYKLIAFIAFLIPFFSWSNITAQSTRVIYNAEDTEANIILDNNIDAPALFQAWVDAGDAVDIPDKIKAPFVVTPPLARIEAHKSQTLRIYYVGGASLPVEKETVFWLNVLDIPPKPHFADSNKKYIQLAARSRFKLFYRPKGLAGVSRDAPGKILWSMKKNQGKSVLSGKNSTPYYVSFNRIQLSENNTIINIKPDMIPPFGSTDFDISEKISETKNLSVHYEAIGDLGDFIKGSVSLKKNE